MGAHGGDEKCRNPEGKSHFGGLGGWTILKCVGGCGLDLFHVLVNPEMIEDDRQPSGISAVWSHWSGSTTLHGAISLKTVFVLASMRT
jgi:hypothetical protein